MRGDLVQDRLRVQEQSASPFLKRSRQSAEKSPPAASMAMTMAEFRDYMENNTNKRFDGIEDKISGMQGTVDRINDNVKANAAKIESHEAKIAEICAEVKKMKQDPFPPLGRPLGPPSVPTPLPSPTDDREFDLARRSLRLWPIAGSTENDLWDSAGLFLGSNLALEGKLNEAAIDCIKRVDIPSGPGVRDEALIRFKDATIRDMVIGSASKLSAFIGSDGKATAGMRMEVPPRLQQTFRVLFKYGQNLRARHGPGTRRHVKFCDLDRTLYLNVKLPQDDNWSKVSIEVAMRGMKAKRSIDDGQLERRLDITGPIADARPRAASTSNPPPSSAASAWPRRPGGSTSS